MQERVTGSKIKVTGSKVKVKVTGVKGQIMVRSLSNLVGGCRFTAELPLRGSFLERSRSLGSKVNPHWGERSNNGPIPIKLGG